MQDVWCQGLGWDDELSGEVLNKWNRWISQMPDIKKTIIPRCYSRNMKTSCRLELHVFCDASEKSFSAVAYFKVCTAEGINICFVMAKYRVSPLRPVSNPRLELQFSFPQQF